MDLVLFIAMAIGVLGSILIERQLHNSNWSEIKIPVHSDDISKLSLINNTEFTP